MMKSTPFKRALMAQSAAAAVMALAPSAQEQSALFDLGHNSGPDVNTKALREMVSPKLEEMGERPPFPTRLSATKGSPYYDANIAARLGIEFEGAKRKNDVREYCIEDPETGRGWVEIEARLPNGKPRIERGRYITVRKYGIIKPFWQR